MNLHELLHDQLILSWRGQKSWFWAWTRKHRWKNLQNTRDTCWTLQRAVCLPAFLYWKILSTNNSTSVRCTYVQQSSNILPSGAMTKIYYKEKAEKRWSFSPFVAISGRFRHLRRGFKNKNAHFRKNRYKLYINFTSPLRFIYVLHCGGGGMEDYFKFSKFIMYNTWAYVKTYGHLDTFTFKSSFDILKSFSSLYFIQPVHPLICSPAELAKNPQRLRPPLA
mgnify:CR=1 FL=1